MGWRAANEQRRDHPHRPRTASQPAALPLANNKPLLHPSGRGGLFLRGFLWLHLPHRERGGGNDGGNLSCSSLSIVRTWVAWCVMDGRQPFRSLGASDFETCTFSIGTSGRPSTSDPGTTPSKGYGGRKSSGRPPGVILLNLCFFPFLSLTFSCVYFASVIFLCYCFLEALGRVSSCFLCWGRFSSLSLFYSTLSFRLPRLSRPSALISSSPVYITLFLLSGVMMR